MQIEAGKYYRTRDGRKVGPMVLNDPNTLFCFDDGSNTGWKSDGGCGFSIERDQDLIAEWSEPMQIKEGHYYIDADGEKVGPIIDSTMGLHYHTSEYYFDDNGKSIEGDDPDLVAEPPLRSELLSCSLKPHQPTHSAASCQSLPTQSTLPLMATISSKPSNMRSSCGKLRG